MKKGIFFDLYGTLIDINTDEYDLRVYATLSQYLAYHLINITPEKLKETYFEEIQLYWNLSKELYPEVDLYKVFSDIMHRYGKRKYSRSVIIYTAMLFRSLTIRRFEVFEGLYDVLATLVEKAELAIISDAQWIFTPPEMEMLGLTRFIRFNILSSQVGFKKPDVRLFEMAMRRLVVKPEESVYVGDNPSKDLVGAKKSGMKFILFRPENKSCNDFQPDSHFNNYSELIKILEKI
jgi:putative hydrolase of the HAD superfamily